MTTSDICKRWDFYETEIPQNGRSEAKACVCVAHKYDFAKGGDLQPKVVKFSQNVWIGRRRELTSVTETCRKRGLGAEFLAAGDYGDLGAKPLAAGRS